MSGSDSQGHRYAAGVIEARLGRGAQDVLEAAVVLEAWGGMRANSALNLGSRVVPPKPPRWTPGRLTTEESGQRESIVTEAIALMMAILAVASWAGPLSHQIGASVLTQAIAIALPMTLALQWAIRSRYLSRRSGFTCLSHDRLVLLAVAVLGIELPLMFLSSIRAARGHVRRDLGRRHDPRARGWGLLYGALLVASVFALQAELPAYPLLLGLTATSPSCASSECAQAMKAQRNRPGASGARCGPGPWAPRWADCWSATRASAGACTVPSLRSRCCPRSSAASGAGITCGSSTTPSRAACRAPASSRPTSATRAARR